VANSTWYHLFVIERTDTGVVDELCSTSATAPTLPTNYTKKRRIGSFKTDASAHILAFTQYGAANRRQYLWVNQGTDNNAVALNNGTNTSITLASVPAGIKVDALFDVVIQAGITGPTVGIFAVDNTNFTANGSVSRISSTNNASQFTVRTSTSQ